MARISFLLSLLTLCYTNVIAQVDHWESVVLEGDTFMFLIPSSQPPAQWIQLGFDDSQWAQGDSGFGYGDNDDNTIIPNPTITLYLRKTFNIVDFNAIEEVLLHMDYDDGFVAYLNGLEIARDLVSGSPPGFDQPADGLHEATLYQGFTPEAIAVDPSILMPGENILAVEVHNESTTSSDLSAIPFLSLGINTSSTEYSPTPSWFTAPVDIDFVSTSLPIILIETESNQTIPDEPKIGASMKIIRRSDGSANTLEDANDLSALDYSGQVRIEIRGSSSQALPKKSYGFTTYDLNNADKENVSLLGMPKENDWILNSLAFDPSLLRDYLAYNLAITLGEYAARTQYCEVFINGEYNGLYLLQEKLKADNNRIDINKIEPDDNQLPKLSGGYITKADKTTGGDPIAWSMPNYSGWTTDFIHEVPSPQEATNQQTQYIRSVFEDLRTTSLAGNRSLVDGYPSIIDIPSFVDYFIVNELASNPDAYQFSTYFHKDRNGKLRAGPIWDINLSFGNDLFQWGFDRSHTDIWQFEEENVGATFWKDLFDDSEFNCLLAKRWNQLRQQGQPLHLNSIEQRIDSSVSLFQDAIEREEAKWSRIGDHANEISQMKSWIAQRISWMDARLSSSSECSNPALPELVISKIHYHPNSDLFEEDDLEFIEITNRGTTEVDLTGIYFGGTGLVYQFPIGVTMAAGQRIMLANDAETFEESYGTAPFGEFSRNLSNSGRSIELLDGWGSQIDIVTYSDDAPWPSEADGDGSYLELIGINTDNDDPANWKATPTEGFVTAIDALSATQVYPNPSSDYLIIQSQSVISEIRVLDINGRLLDKMTPRLSSYYYNTRFLHVGVYLLLIQNAGGLEQQRIIIQK
ncbi:MAG: CotH kinase family protein [Cyclobacteriaceae bacterium]